MDIPEKRLIRHSVPDSDVVHAFGFDEAPVLLSGGQGESYRVGDIILKPVDNAELANWSAELMSSIVEDGFRVARPIRTKNGVWIHNGWHAFSYVLGKEVKGRGREKISVSRSFHKALRVYEEPEFLEHRQDPWALADRMTWGEQTLVYGPRLEKVVTRLESLIKPVDLESQLIHGDMTGNILFQDGHLPAVIDLSPYWRPAEFATAVIIVDSIVWDGAEDSLIDQIENTPTMNQLLLRAALWRIKTTEEFVKKYGKGSLDDVNSYSHFIDVLAMRNM